MEGLNPVRKRLVKRLEDGRWSSYNNIAWGRPTVTACPIQIDDVRLPRGIGHEKSRRSGLR
jgi:hypothetical protein